MDTGMLIMTAVLGVAAIGIAAITMDSEDPRAQRSMLKSRAQGAYDDGMTDVEKVIQARELEKQRLNLLMRRQSLGPDHQGAAFARDEALKGMLQDVNSSRGTRQDGEYSLAEDMRLRGRLNNAMAKNALYDEPDLKPRILESQMSKIDHRLLQANKSGVPVDERRQNLELAKAWDTDYGTKHPGIAVAEANVSGKEAAIRFEQAVNAVPEDTADANFDALKALKDPLAPGYDEAILKAKYGRLLNALYADIQTQLALSPDVADDDNALKMYERYEPLTQVFPDLRKANPDPIKLTQRKSAEILSDLKDKWATEMLVASRKTSFDALMAEVERRPESRAFIQTEEVYRDFVNQINLFDAIQSMYDAYVAADDHFKIICVCSANYMKNVNALSGFTFPPEHVTVNDAVKALILAELNGIAAPATVTKVEKLRILMLRTKGLLMDAAALTPAKAAVSAELANEWADVVNCARDTYESRALFLDLFLAFRSRMTQYWTPVDADFAGYAAQAAAASAEMDKRLAPLGRDIKGKVSAATSSYLEEYSKIPVPAFKDYLTVSWTSSPSEALFRDNIPKELHDSEDRIPTFESQKVIMLKAMYDSSWKNVADAAARTAFITSPDGPHALIEYPEVYFPGYDAIVYPRDFSAEVRVLTDAVKTAGGGSAGDIHALSEEIKALPSPMRKVAEKRLHPDSLNVIKRLVHLVLTLSMTVPEGAPDSFDTEKKVAMYSAFRTRMVEWGLNITDDIATLGVDLTDARARIVAIIDDAYAAPPSDEEKMSLIKHIHRKVRFAHDLLPAAPAAVPDYYSTIADITPALQGAPGPLTVEGTWAHVMAQSDVDVPGDFSERQKAFNRFEKVVTKYWKDVEVAFPGFGAQLSSVEAKRKDLVRNVGGDIVKLAALAMDTPPGTYSDVLIDDMKVKLQQSTAPGYDMSNFYTLMPDYLHQLDFGRFYEAVGNLDNQIYQALDMVWADWVDRDDDDDNDAMIAAAGRLTEYPKDIFTV